MRLYYGVVENRQDPMALGRCQVRVAGVHTYDKSLLPTEDLPWSLPVSPVTSAAMNGIGYTPLGPVEGTTVLIMFADGESMQQPIMFGSIGGVSSTPLPVDAAQQGGVGAAEEPPTELTTIAGPVTGNQLTFVDDLYGRINLTSGLTADMRVIGYGLPATTKIVSIDSQNTITINERVVDYGKNIIKFGAAPTNSAALLRSQEYRNTVSNVTPGSVSSTVTDSESSHTPSATSTNNDIPIVPPRGAASNEQKAIEGIRALISACDEVGLSTKEQKCALLGICGGESGWIPKEESHNYTSKARLQQLFSFVDDQEAEQYYNARAKGMSKATFFSFIYGPSQRGRGFLGNLTDEDGGKFFGRGFIQLTGRSNYERYNRLLREAGVTGVDIVNNPDTLNSDLRVSALVAAIYLKDRVPSSVSPTAHPAYFYAAKRAVGVNTGDIAARKLSYYEHFYGQSSGGALRSADVPPPDVPAETADAPPPSTPQVFTPAPSQDSIERGTANYGFRDPNSKYPLKRFLNEVDTNRLARGVIEDTIVPLKDATRVVDIPKGVVGGTWGQPEVPFAAQYPYNHVMETESGHIQEFDDTPGQERINTYHRSGTYTEIDANGTQVNYIVGDNYILMERNGNIHVAGVCNITIDGQTNVFVQADANIEVAQNANIEVGNNLSVNVHRDIDVVAGGDMKVSVAGDYSLTAANIFNYTAGEMKSQADSGMHQQSGDFMYLASTSGMQIHDASQVNIESAGSFDMLAGGTMNVDYSEGHFGEGATGAGIADTIGNGLETESRKNADGDPDWTFTPVEEGTPKNIFYAPLITPERHFNELTRHETPEEWDTPEGRSQTHEMVVSGDPNAPRISDVVPAESNTTQTGGAQTTVMPDCVNIRNQTNFTNDFRLSTHFTLGMLIDGGVNGRHRLVDQNLSDGNTSRVYTKQEIVCNLAALAQNVLEPALSVLPGGIDGYGSRWRINSGYRLRGVVGNESARSQHPKGMAVDIGIIGDGLSDKIQKTYDIVNQLERVVPYDQLILEYRHSSSVWIHVSYSEARRRMAFTMVNDSTYRRNSQGMPAGFYQLGSIPPKG